MKEQPMLVINRKAYPKVTAFRVGLRPEQERRVRTAALREGIPMQEWMALAADMMARVALGEKLPGDPGAS